MILLSQLLIFFQIFTILAKDYIEDGKMSGPSDIYALYPTKILKRSRIRQDRNGKQVVRGRLDTLGGLSDFVRRIICFTLHKHTI
jgi:hypothetical protein